MNADEMRQQALDRYAPKKAGAPKPKPQVTAKKKTNEVVNLKPKVNYTTKTPVKDLLEGVLSKEPTGPSLEKNDVKRLVTKQSIDIMKSLLKK